MVDPLERVIRPIVEGQIRSFTYDHPEVVEAVTWFKPREDKRTTFVNSVAKRIIRDLLCPTTRAQLAAALVELYDCKGRHGVDCGTSAAATGGGVEVLAAPSPTYDRPGVEL